MGSVFGLEEGTNAYESIPLFANVSPNLVISIESPLVKRRVTTSFVFASSQRLTVPRNDSRVPASSRKQEVWHSSKTLSSVMEWCVWVCRKRMPMSSWALMSMFWFCWGRSPTKAES